LIDEFERKRDVDGNLLVNAISEDFIPVTSLNVVRWGDSRFFLVPYGHGLINKFCIVGPNKDKSGLTCKGVHHPKTAIHLHHIKAVMGKIKEYRWDLKEVLTAPAEPKVITGMLPPPNLPLSPSFSSTTPASPDIVDTDSSSLPTAPLPSTVPPPPKASKFPLSYKPINLDLDMTIKNKLRKQTFEYSKIPVAFLPEKPPAVCKCTTIDIDGKTTYITPYKRELELLYSGCTLWLEHGPIKKR
jgi:hypothetical protein